MDYLRSVPGQEDAGSKTDQFFRWLAGETGENPPLLAPYGAAADGEGKIWVTDPGSGILHLFDLKGGKVEAFASFGEVSLRTPIGVAADVERQRLYVSDSGLGTVLIADFDGNHLGEIRPAGGYGRPGGVALDSAGNLYVVDILAGRVECFSPGREHLRTFGSPGQFNRPSNVWVDGEGRVFVTDSMNFRVAVLGKDGIQVASIGELGDAPGTFARPRGVAVDSDGHIYVADAAFDNIQVFDLAGNLLIHFGGSGTGEGNFNLPAGLFFDRQDRLYVVDSHNRRVQILQYLSNLN